MTFALASLDETWIGGAVAERRLTHGRAEQHGNIIEATDARDDALVAQCEAAMARLRAAAPRDGRVRMVARATHEGVEASMTITIRGMSIVTTAEHVAEDMRLLECGGHAAALDCRERRRGRRTPEKLVWHNGSAAVLLHEAFGHPAELGLPQPQWPEWLHLDAPLAMRRESFHDVPLLRMTTVTVTQTNAPLSPPKHAIEIHLVRGGSYDALTDVVTLDIAYAQMAGEPVAPFTIRATRDAIARSIAGASGDPIRYPGVICSREGQQLVVGSYAPLLVTEPLA